MVRAAEHAAQAPAAEPVEALQRPGPASALLALQRTAGNRAVVRLLSRQTVPEEAVPTAPETTSDMPLPERSHLQRGSSQTPTPLPGARPPGCKFEESAPRVPGQQDPILLSIVGPNLMSKGGYDWRVAFELPAPASANGWLIQQRHQNSSGNTQGSGNCIWETWKVLAGHTTPEARLNGYDDTYVNSTVLPAGPGRTWWQHLGVVSFYPGSLPPEFGPETPETTNYMSTKPPSGWNGHGQRHHCFSVTLNPPPQGQPAHRLVADDGRNEVIITA